MEGGAALKLLTLSRLSFTCMHLELVSSKVGVLFRRLLGLMLDTHMFFVRPVFPLAAWEVLVPQISPATFHPQPQVLVGAHPPAISQGACFILRLQLIACCAGHTEQNLHGFRTTASDWQQCKNCELELEHRRVMQLHTCKESLRTYMYAAVQVLQLPCLKFYTLSWSSAIGAMCSN